ncbi:MAG: ATP-binding cassette domain-containing protein, partial [Oscillospiraceae bacterium]
KKNSIYGLLGPNGAGKSTTMNIITGYISSSTGNVLIDGVDVLEEPKKAKKMIGYLPEHPPLYLDMTVEAYLNFIYDLKGATLPRKAHIAEICGLVKIGSVYKRLIKNLSKGFRQRVGIAQALIGNPPVLILDEPTVGLDPKQIIEIRSLIKALGKNHTVILSSHILSEIEAVCERVIVINNGKLIADGNPDTLAKEYTKDYRLIARVKGPQSDIYSAFSTISGLQTLQDLGQKEAGTYDFCLVPNPGKDIRADIFNRVCDRGWTLLSLKSTELSLEDIFIKLTGAVSKIGGKK